MTTVVPAKHLGWSEDNYPIAADMALDGRALGGLGEITATTGTITITIPPNLGWRRLQIGVFYNNGGASVTFAAGAGVTLRSIGGNLSMAGQDAWVQLCYLGNDTYSLAGNLTA